MFHVMSLHTSLVQLHSGGWRRALFLSRSPQAPEKKNRCGGRLCALVLRAPSLFRSPRSAASLIYFRSALRASFLGSRSASVDMFDRYTIERIHLARMVTYLPIRAAQKPVKNAPTYLSPAPNGHQRISVNGLFATDGLFAAKRCFRRSAPTSPPSSTPLPAHEKELVTSFPTLCGRPPAPTGTAGSVHLRPLLFADNARFRFSRVFMV